MELFSINSKKIEVIHEGVELPGGADVEGYCKLYQPVKKKYDITSDYFFSLGTLEPRKNIGLVLDALRQILEKNPEVLRNKEYLIAGVKGWKFQDIFDKIDEVNRISQAKIGSDFVRYLGYIPHADKFPLMACSLFFVFPSLYEGFGLPVLEAMKLGTPVISSNISSIPEVTSDAALLINPEDTAEMREALLKFLKSDEARKRYASRAKQQADKFTWEKAAIKTIEVYKNIK